VSDDNGRTWSATGWDTDVAAVCVALACSGEDADVLYGATLTNVWKSDDGGDNWEDLSLPAGAATTGITCIAVGYADDDPHLFVGYDLDSDADGDGDVFYYHDAPFASVWTDLDVCAPDSAVAINTSDVYGIACSPEFADDTLVVAVIADATNSFVTANSGAGIGATAWDDLEILDDAAVPAAFVIT